MIPIRTQSIRTAVALSAFIDSYQYRNRGILDLILSSLVPVPHNDISHVFKITVADVENGCSAVTGQWSLLGHRGPPRSATSTCTAVPVQCVLVHEKELRKTQTAFCCCLHSVTLMNTSVTDEQNSIEENQDGKHGMNHTTRERT